MTKQERESFVADLHVGIISVAENGRGPLTVPIWYSYEPGGEVRVVTGGTSRKAQLLRTAYKYVSVEGPIVAIEPANLDRDRRPLAHRYFGVRAGDQYIERTRAETVENVLVRMRPERWLTVDYGNVYRSS